jgi:hypothetical protein
MRPMKPPYLWRTYVDVSLKRPAQKLAFEQEKELRQVISEALRKGLEKIAKEGIEKID